MQKLKMCTNLFLWSICLFFIIFLYYCPGHTIGHNSHRLEPNGGGESGRGFGSGGPTDDLHGLDDSAFIASEEKCPCISRDQCPRIYGETATDVKELGFLRPCKEFGTVRCCGVTVSIRIETEKEGDRDMFDNLKRSPTKTIEENATTTTALDGSGATKFGSVVDEGGIHSNYLWDRDEDLDVAESNLSNIESGGSNANDEEGGKTSSTVTSLPPPARPTRLRPRKKLMQRAQLAPGAANIKDKILDMNLRTSSNENDQSRVNKELNLDGHKSENQSGSDGGNAGNDGEREDSVPSSVAGTQEMSKISKLRIVRPGGPNMRRLNQQQTHASNKQDQDKSQIPESSTAGQEVGGASGGQSPVPRMRKRIVRRKKLNSFSPVSSETESLPGQPETAANKVYSELEGPVPSFSLPPQGQAELISSTEHVPEPEEPRPTLNPVAPTQQQPNTNKFMGKHGPHSVLIKRKPITSSWQAADSITDESKTKLTTNSKNSFNTDSSEEEEGIVTQQHIRTAAPFKFPKFQNNSTATKMGNVENAGLPEEKAEHETETVTKETLPASRPSLLGITKPLRKRLRPIRPTPEKTSDDPAPKVSILTPGSSETSNTATSTSYTSSSSSSSSNYPNPIRKLQKLRKRVRPLLASTPKPAAEPEVRNPALASPEFDDESKEEAIRIEAPTTPKYKFSPSVSYTESRRKEAKFPPRAPVVSAHEAHDRDSDTENVPHLPMRIHAGEGRDAESDVDTGSSSHSGTPSITGASKESDTALTSKTAAAGKIENEFASTSASSLLSPVASFPISTQQHSAAAETAVAPRPAQPSTHVAHANNLQSVKLRTHSKNDDEGEASEHEVGEKVFTPHGTRQMVRHSQEHERVPKPTAEHETTPLVTSMYSKIRVGNNRHKNRLTVHEDEEEPAGVHIQGNNLMTPSAPKKQDHFVETKKGGSRRFSVPSAFDIVESNEFQATPRPISTHHRYHAAEEEEEESYDVILDKDVRHNLKKTTHNRLADVSQEETRTFEYVNRHPATPTAAAATVTLPPITEPKRMRIRRPTATAAAIASGTATNEQTTLANHGTKKRLHTKVEFGDVVEEMQVHTDLAPPEKLGNYESIKSTTAFPPYKPRPTSSTASPITSAYSGSSNSQSKRRRVEKPSLLLQSESSGLDTQEHVQNINSGIDSSRIDSQYNHHKYSHEYEQPQTQTTPAPYVHHHRNTKAEVEQQKHAKGISNYYFNEVSTTPAYYIHTSPLPSFGKAAAAGTDGEEPESGSKFVFPPYRFEITSRPDTEKDEAQKSKHEIIYSATVPTTTPSPRTEAAYYHHITPTESPYGGMQYPSTTPMPMPAFMYYTSTGVPTKEDDGLYHRHHHLHYLANNDNMGPSTPAPGHSTVAFSGGFTPIRSKNSSSTRFQAPDIFDLPSSLNANTAYSYETTSPSPVTPSPIVSYSGHGLHAYNNEHAKPAPYEHVRMFPGHVEIGGTKRPVSVQVKVAGLNGQTHPQHVQPTTTGGSSKPQLQTVIDIQNPRESTPDYVQYHQSSHHQESPHHSTRTEIVNNAVTSSNPEGLGGGSGSPSPLHHQLYQHFPKDRNAGGLGTLHHQSNFGGGMQVNEASLNTPHAQNVVQVQHQYKSTSYEHSPLNQIPLQTQEELNALRSQMQTTINITNPLANIQQQQKHQQQYFGHVSSTPSPLLFSSAFENSLKQNAFQAQQQSNEPSPSEQFKAPLNGDSVPGKAHSNHQAWNAFGTSHQSMTPSFASGANLLSQTTAADGNDGRSKQLSSQMFRHNFNGMFPASPQQPVIQFIQHSRPLTDAPTTPSSVWKFPEPQPQVPQQQQPQILHQSQSLQYQTHGEYAGSGGFPQAIRGGQLLPLAPLQQQPQQHTQATSGLTGGGGPPHEMMNRPHPISVIQFGSAVANDGHVKGQQMNGGQFGVDQQWQKRPTSNVNLPGGLIRIPQQPPPKNAPHYIKEYHQHHSISQEILSQLKTSNRFNPFSGNARTSRATNLDDIEIIKASQDAEATAAGNDETVSAQETPKDAGNAPAVSVPASATALSADEKKDIMNNVDFVVIHSKKEGAEEEKSAAEGKETAFTQPEVVSYFSLPETARSSDPLGGDEGESDVSQQLTKSSDSDNDNDNDGADEKNGDGSFSEPKTVQRGFLPILPYSETDPGPLLVNVKDFNGASRAAKALEDVPPPPPRVVVTLTDDAGSPRPGPQA